MIKKHFTHLSFTLLLLLLGLGTSLSAQDCNANGGMLSLADGTVIGFTCTDDGTEMPFNIIRTGFVGQNSQYFITNAGGTILALPAGGPPFDLTGFPNRTIAIWSLAYSGDLTGEFFIGGNVCAVFSDADCASLSNPFVITRARGDDCDAFNCFADGGMIEFAGGGSSETICINGDPMPLEVTQDGEATGENMTFLITDSNGNILDIPAGNGPFDLSGAGAGTCLIWYLSYDDDLEGLEVGNNADDFDGCFSLSNPLTVVRNAVDAGELSFAGEETEVTICAGDSIPDPIDVFQIDNDAVMGTDFTYVVTDADGNILNPAAPGPTFDFEGAGGGACQIYFLASNGPVGGLEMGAPISGLTGCFDLSNALTIVRNTAEAGAITFEDGNLTQTICAGDGEADPFTVIQTNMEDVTGDTQTFVVTDADGNILNPAAEGPVFDFEGAGGGACQIYYLSYSGDITGLEQGASIDGLMGCFDLSNSLTIVRNTAAAGMITFEDGNMTQTICAGDGEADPFTVIQVNMDDVDGDTQTYVVTDADGNILNPAAEGPVFDFEGAGGGACRIYFLSYTGDITGLEEGENIDNLMGCFDLSNALVITRLTGEDCPGFCGANGGAITFADGSLSDTICAGDGMPDPLDVIQVGGDSLSGSNFTFVITDSEGEILNIPDGNGPFDLEGAGGGACLIWYLAFEDDLTGAEVGQNANNLGGCFDLSNPLTVVRNTGEDCENFCGVEAGMIAFLDGSLTDTICAGDGEADPREVMQTMADMVVGDSVTFVVTDSDGNILNPAAPGPVFDFEGAGGGACRIYYLATDGTVTGLEMGANIDDLGGCFDLSNALVITRNTGDECDNFCGADAGMITFAGGALTDTICAGDGMPDPLTVFQTANDDVTGDNFTYVVTDSDGNILNPAAPGPVFDFEEAGGGACRIYFLASDSTLTGLTMGGSIDSLGGCFDLSNALVVTRNTGDECDNFCDVEAGMISFLDGSMTDTICAGDGEADPREVMQTMGDMVMGDSLTFVVTDADGNILNPAAPGPIFDFEGAGGGACQIYYLATDGTVTGLEMGANIADLGGCFDLSNALSITRNTGDDCDGNDVCEAEAGTITFEGGAMEVTICAGDGIPDPLAVFQSTPDTVNGSNFTYVITDSEGEILNIPDGNGPFDLDGAGEGSCLIWYLAFEDDLTGAEVGLNANDLGGCFDLSNPLTVIRNTGEDCNTGGLDTDFEAVMNGLQELPVPVTTTGFGRLGAVLTGNTLIVGGNFSNLESDFDATVAGGAHLHVGLAGQGGPIALLLTTEVDEDLRGGTFPEAMNVFTISDELANTLRARGMYVNVHTLAHPAGELRGQLLPLANDYKMANLLGANEVPSIVTNAIGGVAVEVNGMDITVSGSFSGLTDEVAEQIAGGAHLHTGIAGRNGPVQFPLVMNIADDSLSATIPAAMNTFTLDSTQMAALQNEMMYVNVHSDAFGSGELRGQVHDYTLTAFYANASGHQARPASIDTDGAGRLLLTYTPDSVLIVSGSINNLSDTIRTDIAGGAHLHLGITGRSGPIEFPLNLEVSDDGLSAMILPDSNRFTLDTLAAGSVYSRQYYVNVHSAAEPSGEIRGQVMNLAKAYFGANLNTFNAVEDASIGEANGFVLHEYVETQLISTGSFSDLFSPFDPTVAGGSNLHVGSPVQVGGPAIPLFPVLDNNRGAGVFPAEANRVDISPDVLAALQAEIIYVNIATEEFPTGEIRGQVLRDDNQFPEASMFAGVDDVSTVLITEDGIQNIDFFSFTTAEDPDSNLVFYGIEVSGAGDFDPLLLIQFADSTDLSFLLQALYEGFVEQGAPNGTIVDLQYRVVSSDGSVRKNGEVITLGIQVNEANLQGSGVAITELNERGELELMNLMNEEIDLSTFRVETSTGDYLVGDLMLLCGEYLLKEGETVTVQLPDFNVTAGELSLTSTTTGEYAGFPVLTSYIAWGDADGAQVQNQQRAILAGLWTPGLTLDVPTTDNSIQLTDPANRGYGLQTPSPCAVNDFSTSTVDQPAAEMLITYPNPVGDQLTLEYRGLRSPNSELQVIDVNGRLLTQQAVTELDGRLTVTTSGLPQGTYLLRLTSDQGVSTLRFIKQ